MENNNNTAFGEKVRSMLRRMLPRYHRCDNTIQWPGNRIFGEYSIRGPHEMHSRRNGVSFVVQGTRSTEQISQTPPHPPTRCKIIGLLVGHTHMASAETVLEHSRRCIIISNMPRSSTAKNFTPPNETERRGDDTGRIRMMNSPPRSWTRRRRASAWCSCATDPSWCRSGAGAAGTFPWKPSWPTSLACFVLALVFVRDDEIMHHRRRRQPPGFRSLRQPSTKSPKESKQVHSSASINPLPNDGIHQWYNPSAATTTCLWTNPLGSCDFGLPLLSSR